MMRPTYRVLAPLLSWWIVLLPVSFLVIWSGYSMSAVVKGGYKSIPEARTLVLQMSLITMVLLSASAIPSMLQRRLEQRLSLFVSTVVLAAMPLFAYTSYVFLWREHWTAQKGLDEFAAFGPVTGHINAAFFSEFNFLAYLLFVLPILSVLAGALALAYAALFRQKPSVPSL